MPRSRHPSCTTCLDQGIPCALVQGTPCLVQGTPQEALVLLQLNLQPRFQTSYGQTHHLSQCMAWCEQQGDQTHLHDQVIGFWHNIWLTKGKSWIEYDAMINRLCLVYDLTKIQNINVHFHKRNHIVIVFLVW